MKNKRRIKRLKNIGDHFAALWRLFDNWGIPMLGVKVEYDDSCDPGTCFVITLKGRDTKMNRLTVEQALRDYVYRIEWSPK